MPVEPPVPTILLWLLAALAGLSSAVAIHYSFQCSRLARTCLDLRQALRERDAAGREPERIAFQSGYQVGLRRWRGDRGGDGVRLSAMSVGEMGGKLTERVHIAGFPLRVRNKARQLCAWCGFVLIDDDYELMAAAPNEDGIPYDWSKRFWEVNALVAVDGPAGGVTATWVVKEDPENPKLPATCCAFQAPVLRVVT